MSTGFTIAWGRWGEKERFGCQGAGFALAGVAVRLEGAKEYPTEKMAEQRAGSKIRQVANWNLA
jgi:hypothetical protein